jgi:hypothetical protein
MPGTLLNLYAFAVTANLAALAILLRGLSHRNFSSWEKESVIVLTALSLFLWALYFRFRYKHKL